MRGTPLASASAERGLAVNIDPKLKCRKQASLTVSKATQIMSLIRWSFANINEHILPLLFITLVRPPLKYGNIIWGPFNQADEKLEKLGSQIESEPMSSVEAV